MKRKSSTILTMTLLTLSGLSLFVPNGLATGKDTLNTMEVKFVKEAAADNMAEVKMGDLGVKKATSNEVKMFAETVVKDHTMASEELTKLAAQKGVDISAIIAPKHAEMIQDLEKFSGTDFDKHFVAEMVSDHKMDVSHFEKAAASCQNTDLKIWVDKMIPTLKAHLAKAQTLNGDATATAQTTGAAVATKEPDNTARNLRDRDGRTLTPLDQGSSKNDTEITAQIRKGIIAEKSLSVNAHNVKIITTNGKVTLRGPVDNSDEKHLIGQIAARTVQAASVDSQLEVK